MLSSSSSLAGADGLTGTLLAPPSSFLAGTNGLGGAPVAPPSSPHAVCTTAPLPRVFCVVMYAFSVGETEFLPLQALLFLRGKW